MERKHIFSEIAEEVDKYRLTYPNQLFQDVLSYSGIQPPDPILEIGCGFGQATSGFVALGFQRITCVEWAENLARFTREKFQAYPELRVVHSSIESWEGEKNHYKLAISGTANQFIVPAFGYTKVHECLQSGGSIGFCWTVHVQQYDDLFADIRQLYRQYAPHLDDTRMPTPQQAIEDIWQSISGLNLFEDLRVHSYTWDQEYTPSGYVALLNADSQHRQLDVSTRTRLFREIEAAIHRHGGVLKRAQQIALLLGRKR